MIVIGKRKTHEQYLEEVYLAHGDEYKVLGEYTVSKNKVLVKHMECGKEYEVYPYSLTRGFGCQTCAGIKRGKEIKRTHNQFIKQINEIYGNDYAIISEYTDNLVPVVLKHLPCETELSILPISLVRGLNQCFTCFGRNNRKSHDDFLIEFNELANEEYLLLNDYVKSDVKVRIKHIACDSEFEMIPGNFTNGQRCPFCRSNALKTHDRFVEEVFAKLGSEYEILGTYTGGYDRIEVKHLKCDRTYDVIARNLIQGVRCYECHGLRMENKKPETYRLEVFQIVGVEYRVLHDYEDGHKPLLMKHNICGHEYEVAPNNFLHDKRCPECARKARMKTPEQFKREVFELVGEEYTMLSEYERTMVKFKIKHNACGHEYLIEPTAFIAGNRCPKCKIASKGEKYIYELLKKEKLDFLPEMRFEDCRKINPLPFDFYIENKLLIEYDGQHHFMVIKYGKGIDKEIDANLRLRETQLRDLIKNQYCIDNNIPLIRIPYWDLKKTRDIVINVLLRFNLLENPLLINYKIIDIDKYIVDSNWDQSEYINRKKKKQQEKVLEVV